MPKGKNGPKQNANAQPKPKNNAQRRPKKQNKPRPPTGPNRQVQAPVAYGNASQIAGPRYSASKNGSVCVRHEELVGNVNGSTGFAVTTYRINPGLPTMFAWLSSIAPNYESYKFRRLQFKYVPACSTSTSGVIYLTVEFDPQDPAPTSERQIATYDGCRTGVVWTRHTYDCAHRNLSKRSSYFVRNGSVPNDDLPFYDVGYLIISTTGNPDTNMVGKLWVEYDIELTTPQLNNLAVGNSLSGFVSGTDAFATAPPLVGNAPLVLTVASNIATFTASAPYSSLVALNLGGTGLAPPATGGTATTSAKATLGNAAATSFVSQYTVLFNEGDTFTLNFSTFTTVTGYFLRFGQYNVNNG